MKTRGGFTLVELLLAGAILATISFGALIGTMRIQKLISQRSELMMADGFCWDVAWKLFNDDYGSLKLFTQDLTNGVTCRVIRGRVLPKELQTGIGKFEFLSPLQFKDSPPVCYITLSNAVDEAGNANPDYGICIGVNLAWGPAEDRSILLPRSDVDAKHVYQHDISVLRSNFARMLK